MTFWCSFFCTQLKIFGENPEKQRYYIRRAIKKELKMHTSEWMTKNITYRHSIIFSSWRVWSKRIVWNEKFIGHSRGVFKLLTRVKKWTVGEIGLSFGRQYQSVGATCKWSSAYLVSIINKLLFDLITYSIIIISSFAFLAFLWFISCNIVGRLLLLSMLYRFYLTLKEQFVAQKR